MLLRILAMRITLAFEVVKLVFIMITMWCNSTIYIASIIHGAEKLEEQLNCSKTTFVLYSLNFNMPTKEWTQ